jgi:hypothetical protein
MVMHSLPSPSFYDRPLLWARLQATSQALQLDSLPRQAPFFCDRASFSVHQQATLQA